MSKRQDDREENRGRYRFDNVFPNIKTKDLSTVSFCELTRHKGCIWPQCDCEIKSDHIVCVPPVKPRYRLIHVPDALGYWKCYRVCTPPLLGKWVQTLSYAGWCRVGRAVIADGSLTLDRG